MKIASVEAYPLEAKVNEPYLSPSGNVYTRRTAFLVRVTTDDGLEGWGQTDGPAGTLAAACEELFAPLLVGRDPTATQTLWSQMQRAARRLGTGLNRLVGALDVALWDLRGQVQGRSIAQLMGATGGGRFPAVATAVFYQPGGSSLQHRVEIAVGYAETGFRAVKVKVGGLPPSEDLKHLEAIQEALGERVMISVDANCSYRTRTAVSMARRLADMGVYWFEEPLPLEDLGGYRAVSEAGGLWVAGGQALPSAEAFLPLLEAHALHFVQPNISQVGGFTETQRLVAVAESLGARYSPTGWGTGLTLAASLQMRAVTASIAEAPFPDLDWIECETIDNPLREGVLENPIRPKDGYLEVPSGPGLGVRVNLEAVQGLLAR